MTQDPVVLGQNNADANAVSKWTKDEAKARSIIILTLSDEASMGVLDDNLSAKQIWTILTNQFNPSSALQQLTLAREIQELQLGEKEPVETYGSKLKNLFQLSALAGRTYNEVDKIFWLLSGLNQNYAEVKAQLQRAPPASLEDALAILRIANQELDRNAAPPIALNVMHRKRQLKNPMPPRTQNSNRRHRHQSKGKNTITCDYCGKLNHSEVECRKKIRDSKPNPSLHLVTATALTCSLESRDIWIVDTGASHHITWDKSLLINFKPIVSHVSFGDNSTSPIEGTGDCAIQIGSQTLQLSEVLYAPEMKKTFCR